MLFALPYAIPDECIVSAVPEKTCVLSPLVPGDRSTYVYGAGQEQAYYEGYRCARFALSPRKGGWDCLRHYEVLAAGCVPLMEGLEHCPSATMVSFPKELVLEARALWPWQDTPDAQARYDATVRALLEHMRLHCSTSALAEMFLSYFPTLPVAPKVLMLNCDPGENYTRELLSVALRRRLGAFFVEVPRNDVLYKGADLSKAYGYGFTYGGRLDEEPLDRTHIAERLAEREWNLVIYGKTGRDDGWQGQLPNQPFLKEVMENYSSDEIVFLFGGDGCQSFVSSPWKELYTPVLLQHLQVGHCCVRELEI